MDWLSRMTHSTRRSKRTGASVVMKWGKGVIWKGAWGLRKKSNSYDGEPFALVVGMSLEKHTADNDSDIKSILFITDNSSVIMNIMWTQAHPSQQLLILFST